MFLVSPDWGGGVHGKKDTQQWFEQKLLGAVEAGPIWPVVCLLFVMWEWYFWHHSDLVVHAWCVQMCTDMHKHIIICFRHFLTSTLQTNIACLYFTLSVSIWFIFWIFMSRLQTHGGRQPLSLFLRRVDVGVLPLPFQVLGAATGEAFLLGFHSERDHF